MSEIDEIVFVGCHQMRHAAAGGMRGRAAELFERNVLSGDRLDDLGTRDEHLRDPFGHDDEIGDRGRVDGAARARPGDQADLRNHAARHHVAPEDLGISAERNDALLNARAAGIVDADHRRASPQREIHHLADLLRVRLAERTSEYRKVLGEEKDLAAVDRRPSGKDSIAEKLFFVEPERVGAMNDEAVELGKRSIVDEGSDALARRALAAGALLFGRFAPGGLAGRLALAPQLVVLLAVRLH